MRGERNGAPVIDPHTINCQQLVALVTSYFDGALTEAERLQFDAHLDACDGCRRHLDQVRLTVRAAGRLREEDLPEELRNRLLVAFRTWKLEPRHIG